MLPTNWQPCGSLPPSSTTPSSPTSSSSGTYLATCKSKTTSFLARLPWPLAFARRPCRPTSTPFASLCTAWPTRPSSRRPCPATTLLGSFCTLCRGKLHWAFHPGYAFCPCQRCISYQRQLPTCTQSRCSCPVPPHRRVRRTLQPFPNVASRPTCSSCCTVPCWQPSTRSFPAGAGTSLSTASGCQGSSSEWQADHLSHQPARRTSSATWASNICP
mmetsp:Transcript_13512/g.42544  ORF Transcript_13512/g.42544 Transcript_13512/m.42544 type:complete len:216 (-) Transcript_13512:60-707(-)